MAAPTIAHSIALLLALAFASPPAAAAPPSCAAPSLAESALRRPDSCPLFSQRVAVGVVEGDEASLQRALNLVHRNRGEFVAMLFYASWCPFSRTCRPNFEMLASLFPTVRHFAFEQSIIRPSILSRYGVHGFPTLFLLNSTMRVRYHGPRTVTSLIDFYNSVAGVDPASPDEISMQRLIDPPTDIDIEDIAEQENCPVSWARSPEKLLQQDSYLVLASCFLVMRLLHLFLPKLYACVQRAWRRQSRYASLMSLCDHLHLYVEEAKRRFSMLNPCKRSNFQDGAINAREWASKSLVSVSLGESSSGKVYTSGKR